VVAYRFAKDWFFEVEAALDAARTREVTDKAAEWERLVQVAQLRDALEAELLSLPAERQPEANRLLREIAGWSTGDDLLEALQGAQRNRAARRGAEPAPAGEVPPTVVT
jgi:hypothetical protein